MAAKKKPSASPGATPSLTPSTNPLLGMDAPTIAQAITGHLEYSLAKDQYSATPLDGYKSLALAVRDRLFERWSETQQQYYDTPTKRVYYLSLEFLIGRALRNAVLNLGIEGEVEKAMEALGTSMENVEERESDAGLGNGGLGRLAACFLDSMATLALPAYGYGIRYEYGIFFQRIFGGRQVETPDNWLRYGNPWEIERPEYLYPVEFYGEVGEADKTDGSLARSWTGGQKVMAMAYDTPVPGYRNGTVNNLRLWAAKSTREFDLDYFNHGDYERAVSDKAQTETISKVLYPNDNVFEGRELRLKQEYFFVSATLQDIVRRYRKTSGDDFGRFPDLVAVQLNDTHPAIAIPELMRLLVDVYHVDWERAWQITVATFGYTNHTILPEALEKWPVGLFGRVLPRHLGIVFEINQRFLEDVRRRYPGDEDRVRRVSIIEEGDEKKVRMANLAIVGSHSVNGVSRLHSEILVQRVFRDFHEIWPERFNNKTNGITQRRWLRSCNPGLAELISSRVGEGWITNLDELHALAPLAANAEFRKRWEEEKLANKQRLAGYIADRTGVIVDPSSLFDCQVKRIHEYKRQLLNALHVIALAQRIRERGQHTVVPRTVIFAGKAAPGYWMAKLIIRLIHGIAEVVNNDPLVGDALKVVFLANYGVSLAEKIMPAADLSEQISTAGTEASGTGNMKFALNGALTIGTLDGANVEIREEVGADNFFLFGLTEQQIREWRQAGYDPRQVYAANEELRAAVDELRGNRFCPGEPGLFEPIVSSLLDHGDEYMVLADFDSYASCQERVARVRRDREQWTRMAIANVAAMGRFSSDSTIQAYAREIWGVRPVPVGATPRRGRPRAGGSDRARATAAARKKGKAKGK
jgi:glycogen phosphorylase